MVALSLVQKENWTTGREISPSEVTEDGGQSSDMVCKRHKGTKLALLLHIIDGFVIEESNVPFKGDEEEEEANDPSVAQQQEGQQQAAEEDKEAEIVNASMNSYPEDKDELMSLLPTTCKYCGGELPEDRAMWGKRFCSVSCSKKYSVTCSQRVRRALHIRRTSQSTPNTKDYTDHSDINRSAGKKRRGGPSRGSSISETPDTTMNTDESASKKKLIPSPPAKFDNIDLHFTFPPREPLGFGLDNFDVEEDLYEGIEPLMKFSVIPMIKWTSMEVFDYINKIAGCSDYAKQFRDEEIDGQALLLLRVEHMIHTMNLKLGPALKIASHLRLIKLQYGVETHSKYLSSPV